MRASSPRSHLPGPGPARVSRSVAQGVADYLRLHDRMATLLPVVERLVALDKDCAALLSTIFGDCRALRLDEGTLVLSVPNPALATKLKQQLPKLQTGLAKRGWQVSAVRLKVQVGKISPKTSPGKEISFPPRAAQAMADLHLALDDSPANQALKAALQALVQRHTAPTGKD